MKKYYWMSKPDETTEKRLNLIIKILGDGIRTVRNIAYKLYPNLHGKALDRKYNTTIKDLVKLRTSGRVRFEQIKEMRTRLSNPDGYQSLQDFMDRQEKEDLDLYYSLSIRPAHIKPFEVWYEKETVIDDFEGICMAYDVPSLTIRGKPQWSTIKKASDRLTDKHEILYFGDNDKIGHQIFETVQDYVHYLGCECSFLWCGITEEQEQKYEYLPKNARLDGLDNVDLHEIIKGSVLKYIDADKLKHIRKQQEKEKEDLKNYKLKVVKKSRD
ncbi:unnamed protein product [marine sediment metagenome]|uniref:Wadjet protein JetD C-terminal domain-containing protein n=1 Tax=marine sediment metagenome TaxID=412755 RepID=X1KUR3_9ZZZZ